MVQLSLPGFQFFSRTHGLQKNSHCLSDHVWYIVHKNVNSKKPLAKQAKKSTKIEPDYLKQKRPWSLLTRRNTEAFSKESMWLRLWATTREGFSEIGFDFLWTLVLAQLRKTWVLTVSQGVSSLRRCCQGEQSGYCRANSCWKSVVQESQSSRISHSISRF